MQLIVFDVDSTLLAVESLDFAISRAAGAQALEEAARITDAGMGGTMDLSQSIARRLEIAVLDRSKIAAAAADLRAQATPGMADLLTDLRADGVAVRAASGGFAELIGPALADLGFAARDIFANGFVFDAAGRAIGAAPANPLSRNGGKAEIVRHLKIDLKAERAVMVGDGITDYEAFEAGAADAFIGFGAIAARKAVRDRAAHYATSVDALRAILADPAFAA